MASWGSFVHRRRWWVMVVSALALAASVGLIARGGTLSDKNTFDFQSIKGFNLESTQLPQSTGESFQLVIGSDAVGVADPRFASALAQLLAPVRADPRVAAVNAPALPPTQPDTRISPDAHWVLVGVTLRASDFAGATSDYAKVRAEISSETLQVYPLGDVPLNSEFNRLAEEDLRAAETKSLIASLVLLLLVFGSIPAALVCLTVGIFAVAGGIGFTYGLSNVTTVSTYSLNIVGLVGLGVAIDYSLFIVSRFREELRRGGTVDTAIAACMQTAGRAIVFSGITVAVGLCALIFYRGSFLGSLGYCGAAVVAISVLYSVTLLPALLCILGPRVDRWRIPLLGGPGRGDGRGFWGRLATAVMRRPILVLVPCLAVLVLAGSPFPQMRLANANVTLLPTDNEVHRGVDVAGAHFPAQAGNTIDVVIDFDAGGPFAPANVAAAYDLAQRLRAVPGVSGVSGYVAYGRGSDSAALYQRTYSRGASGAPAAVAALVRSTTGGNIAVLRAVTPYPVPSDDARSVVRAIRAGDAVPGADVSVTGDTAFDIDFVQFMSDRTPAAVAFVVVVTFCILLLLLRSLVLPIKAVLMNLLSLSAAFGSMVFIFQQGHLSGQLDFTPASIDPTLPILLFCIVFGLSMDYEVFLLTRMQEAYMEHGDNRRAVAEGLEASGRLVTGAAAIMIAVFAAFAMASVVVVKSIGLGMAVAVFVDATIVRALVVPAIMRLLGNANWWAPRWLRPRRASQSPPAAAA